MVLTSLSVSTLLSLALSPIAFLIAFALLLLPALLAPNSRPSGCAKASFATIMQVVGIALMTAGALPAVQSVLEKLVTGVERFSAEMYLALLLLFCAGGVTFLWHERMVEEVDDASRSVPALLLWYTFKTVGYLLTVFAALSILLTMLLTPGVDGTTWWISPTILFLYGLLLCWCTRAPTAKKFSSSPMNGLKKALGLKKRK